MTSLSDFSLESGKEIIAKENGTNVRLQRVRNLMNSSINWGFYIWENSLNLLVKAKNTIIFFKLPEFKEYYGIFHFGSLRKTADISPASFPVVHGV